MVAIVIGVTMINNSEKTQQVAILAEQLSHIVNSVMGFIGKLVPCFVFGSLFNILTGSEFSVFLDAAKLLCSMLAACLFVLLVHTALSCVVARISPAVLWRRSLSTFIIGLTTASSSAAFADNLRVCIQKHGVSQELANFAVPFGQILYKPSTAILSCATPPIPGGTTASYSILFTQLGLPMDSLAIVLTLNVILDFFCTATNLFAGQCVLINASREMGMTTEQAKSKVNP